MRSRWARRLEAELALARRRPWADWPGWFWYHLVRRHSYAYLLHRRCKLGLSRDGLPPSATATGPYSFRLRDVLPSRLRSRDRLN